MTVYCSQDEKTKTKLNNEQNGKPLVFKISFKTVFTIMCSINPFEKQVR